MKKTLLFSVVLILVLLLSITAWSTYRHRVAETEAADFDAWAKSQKLIPVEFVIKTPPETPKDQTLYLSGSAPTLGNWDAAGVPLARQDDGTHRATVELMSGIEHTFKVTRGTWGTVERGPDGAELPDRTLVAPATQPTPVAVTVATWVDQGRSIPGRITVAGQLRLHKKWHSKVLNNDRTLAVYLPPNYDTDTNARYPVLYMQDGQNLFDESTAFAGVEWGADEAAERLIKSDQISPIIIVGIYNTEQRTDEFTPPAMAAPSQKALGDQYAQMLVTEIKPFIDEHYRTLPDRKNTSLAGSSLGALISLYTAHAHPNTFSQLALLTPWLRTANKPLPAELTQLKIDRLWLDMGGSPGQNYPGPSPLPDAQAFSKSLPLPPGPNFHYAEFPDGTHDEPAWSSRIDQVLLFLYGKSPPSNSNNTRGEGDPPSHLSSDGDPPSSYFV